MQNAHETTAQASIEDDVSNENSRRSLSTGKNDHSKCPVCNLHKSQSNSSSVVALAGEDGTDDDLCYCETESEDMEDEDSLFRYVCAAGVFYLRLDIHDRFQQGHNLGGGELP